MCCADGLLAAGGGGKLGSWLDLINEPWISHLRTRRDIVDACLRALLLTADPRYWVVLTFSEKHTMFDSKSRPSCQTR